MIQFACFLGLLALTAFIVAINWGHWTPFTAGCCVVTVGCTAYSGALAVRSVTR